MLAALLTFTSEETFVTPWVSSASAMARPTISALSALPFRVTSPFFASTSMEAFETWLSAWSFPFTMVLITSSSVAPVGAPTTLSFVRTMVVPLSRSDCSSLAPKRHSVIREDTSVLAEAELLEDGLLLVLSEPLAPVVLEDPLVAPMVLLLEPEERSEAVEPLVELRDVSLVLLPLPRDEPELLLEPVLLSEPEVDDVSVERSVEPVDVDPGEDVGEVELLLLVPLPARLPEPLAEREPEAFAVSAEE